jgi:hypothetical protein
MGAKVLADGKTRFTLLTTKPANPAAPTAAELNAGIHQHNHILTSDFLFGAVDSDKVAEKALGSSGNANAIGASNYQIGMTVWRKFLTAGGFDAADEAGWNAVKVKGVTLWAYARQTDKEADAAWAAGDEIYLGAEWVNDTPQRTDGTGFVKYRVPGEVQKGYPFIAVAA